eukprot:COSAG02_NODE_2113_length_9800_cov_53.566643_8_plen_808_part_00
MRRQASAGDQAKQLCFLLRQKQKPDGRPYTVWYDNEMPVRDTAAMKEGVAHSDNFLLFLSGDRPATGRTALVTFVQTACKALFDCLAEPFLGCHNERKTAHIAAVEALPLMHLVDSEPKSDRQSVGEHNPLAGGVTSKSERDRAQSHPILEQLQLTEYSAALHERGLLSRLETATDEELAQAGLKMLHRRALLGVTAEIAAAEAQVEPSPMEPEPEEPEPDAFAGLLRTEPGNRSLQSGLVEPVVDQPPGTLQTVWVRDCEDSLWIRGVVVGRDVRCTPPKPLVRAQGGSWVFIEDFGVVSGRALPFSEEWRRPRVWQQLELQPPGVSMHDIIRFHRWPQLWDIAVELSDLSEQEARQLAVLRFFMWHVAQPVAYFVVLLVSFDDLNSTQRKFGMVVAAREGVYLLMTVVCAVISPAFLLVDVIASARTNEDPPFSGYSFLALYVFAPDKIVSYFTSRCSMEFAAYRFAVLGVDTGCITCIIPVVQGLIGTVLFFGDMSSFAALGAGIAAQDMPTPLATGYIFTSLGCLCFLALLIVRMVTSYRAGTNVSDTYFNATMFYGLYVVVSAKTGVDLAHTSHDTSAASTLCAGSLTRIAQLPCALANTTVAGCAPGSQIVFESVNASCAEVADTFLQIYFESSDNWMWMEGEPHEYIAVIIEKIGLPQQPNGFVYDDDQDFEQNWSAMTTVLNEDVASCGCGNVTLPFVHNDERSFANRQHFQRNWGCGCDGCGCDGRAQERCTCGAHPMPLFMRYLILLWPAVAMATYIVVGLCCCAQIFGEDLRYAWRSFWLLVVAEGIMFAIYFFFN